jgi:hypothetical protein
MASARCVRCASSHGSTPLLAGPSVACAAGLQTHPLQRRCFSEVGGGVSSRQGSPCVPRVSQCCQSRGGGSCAVDCADGQVDSNGERAPVNGEHLPKHAQRRVDQLRGGLVSWLLQLEELHVGVGWDGGLQGSKGQWGLPAGKVGSGRNVGSFQHDELVAPVAVVAGEASVHGVPASAVPEPDCNLDGGGHAAPALLLGFLWARTHLRVKVVG